MDLTNDIQTRSAFIMSEDSAFLLRPITTIIRVIIVPPDERWPCCSDEAPRKVKSHN